MLRFRGKKWEVRNQISSRYYPADTKASYAEIEFEGFVLGRRILLLYPDVSRRVYLPGTIDVQSSCTTEQWVIGAMNSRGRNLFGHASGIGP